MPGTDALSRLQGAGQHALELEAVSRYFGALVALADINLTLGAGERRAVLGSNGAGKTTLFNAITGDFPPTTGRVRLFGEDVTDLPCTSGSAADFAAPTRSRSSSGASASSTASTSPAAG